MNDFSGVLVGGMVNAMDCGIVVSEFELSSRYYVHCRTNTLRKGSKPFLLPALREMIALLSF